MSDIFTRKMLSKIRSTQYSSPVDLPRENTITESDNINTRFRILMEEATASNDTWKSFTISSNDTQFGSVRQAQEKMLKTTIPGVTLNPDALVYYPNLDNLVLNGSIESLGITFQFKYRDSSGDGCYIWAEGVQMTSENVTTIEKLRSAFENWRQSIEKDGELMEELKKWSMKE